MKRALLLAIIPALLLQQSAQPAAQSTDGLTFFKNYFVTGDYVVGGTSLWRQGVNGAAAEDIVVSGVPAGVDILAAFLYVQTTEVVQWSGIDHAKFNGYDLGPGSSSVAKALNWDLATQPCWSVGGPASRRLVTYRADVLRFLPVGEDGKPFVNRAHSVVVPDYGIAWPDGDENVVESGGQTRPRAIGASLVVIYRDPTAPYRGIVIDDGGITKPAFATMNHTIKGFYQASATPAARMTHIVGDGRPYLSEKVRLDGNLIATNPFASTAGPKWDTPTFLNLPLSPGAASAAVQVTPNGLLSDCVSYSAMVISTEVQDTDGDGLLDVWESSDPPLPDPNGQLLPNLHAMGADPFQKDLFIELGYMKTDAETTYGGVAKPAHTHRPTHAALKLMGDAFRNAPTPIYLHVDAGESYPTGEADPYIIRGAGLARGGEAIDELVTSCPRGPTDPPWVCQFSDYPGTVGWKTGFRFLRDEVLSGEPAPPLGADDPCDAPGNTCVRRFDRNRRAMFHYALFAHAVGLPVSEQPCLDDHDVPVTDINGSCEVKENPGFRVPRTITGVGDFPGGDILVTLGAFSDADGKPVGTPYMQASTLTHEFGHNAERRHGGEISEPNCKPTYLSVMNYLYQLRGLLDDDGRPHLDFSRAVINPPSDEMALSDASLSFLPYRIGWYAPRSASYFNSTPVLAATKHCDGSPLLPTDVEMVRIDARFAASAVDWNADGDAVDTGLGQDINFNGRLDGTPNPLRGSDDWSNILLNQVGSRRSVGGLFRDTEGLLAVGPLSLDTGRGDYGRGDYGRGDYGRGDYGRGDYGRGDLGRGDYGRGDYGRGDYGRGDYGRGDYGGGDLFVGDPFNPGGELDFETAIVRTPPYEFKACVIGVDCSGDPSEVHKVHVDLTASNVVDVVQYAFYRVTGATLEPGQQWQLVGIAPSELGQVNYSVIDPAQLVNGAQYTYFAVGIFANGTQTELSNVKTITAVNDPPTGVPDSYSTAEDTALTVVAPGVLSNDTDDTNGSLTAALVTQALHGTVGLNANGSFTYTPAPNYNGPDSFTYKASDGISDQHCRDSQHHGHAGERRADRRRRQPTRPPRTRRSARAHQVSWSTTPTSTTTR